MRISIKKIGITAGIIIAVILLLLAGGYFYADHYIKNRLESFIKEGSQDTYTVQVEDISISLIPLGITAKEVQLHSKDSTFIQFSEEDSLATLVEASFPRIEIKGIGLWTYITNTSLPIEHLDIQYPDLQVIRMPAKEVNTVIWKKSGSKQKKSTSIEIGSGHLNNAELSFSQGEINATTKISFFATHIRPNEAKSWPLDSVFLSLSESEYITSDSLYRFTSDSISYHTGSHFMVAEGVKVEPLVKKYEMGHLYGHEADWIRTQIEEIRVEHFDVPRFLKSDTLSIEAIRLQKPDLLVFRDKRLPFPDRPDKPMPYEMVENLPFAVSIDSVQISDGHITYQEHRSGSQKAGEIEFTALQAGGGSITTAPDSYLHLNAQANLMQAGLLEASFKIPITGSPQQHTVSGKLHQMKLTQVNPMLIYVAKLKVESGTVRRLEFDFNYDPTRSDGQLRFVYENLKIALVETGEGKPEQDFDEKIKTFFANTFVIEKSNTLSANNFDQGNINFKRDPKKSIFNYWWKSLLSGILDTFGIDKKI